MVHGAVPSYITGCLCYAGFLDMRNMCIHSRVCGMLARLGTHTVFDWYEFLSDCHVILYPSVEFAKYLQHVSDVDQPALVSLNKHYQLLQFCSQVVIGKHCSSLLTFWGGQLRTTC